MTKTRINNIDSGFFVRKSHTVTTSLSSSSTPTFSPAPSSPLVGGAANDVQSQRGSSHNSDSSVFLAIGLIVAFTVMGCILACLYRRRSARKITTVRSFWDSSVGSGAMSEKHLETNERKPGSTPMVEECPAEGSRATDEEIGIAPGLQVGLHEEEEASSFSKMKLPPTTALPPLPKEARLPHPIHYRSMSSPNVNINRNTQITNVERTKSLGQSMRGLSKSKFNFPPPPRHPPNLPTSHHSNPIITNSETHDPEYLTFTSTSPTLNNYVVHVTPPPDDSNYLPPSQPSFTKSAKSPYTSNVYEKSVHSDNNEKTTKNGVGAFLTPLPKVELTDADLCINFDRLSIFKDRTTPNKEYYSVGAGEKSDHKSQVMTTKDGART